MLPGLKLAAGHAQFLQQQVLYQSFVAKPDRFEPPSGF